jgi:hypothetical protein
MSFFHRHDFELIAETYEPPVTRSFECFSESLFDRALFGITTFVWKCRDKSCGKIETVSTLGKKVS